MRNSKLPRWISASLAAAGLLLSLRSIPEAASPGRARRLVLKDRYSKSATKPGPGPLLTLRGKHLTERNYEDVRDVGLRLLRQYPPDTHFVLGLGRALSTLVGFLQNLGPDVARALPASGLRDRDPFDHYAAFSDHLDRFLPDDVKRGERRLVVIDRVYGGNTLERFGRLVRKYAADRRLPEPAVVGMFWSPRSSRGFTFFDTSKERELFLLGSRLSEDYEEDVAEYEGKFLVGQDSPDRLRPNPEYTKMRVGLKQRMKADRTLHEALRRDFARLLEE